MASERVKKATARLRDAEERARVLNRRAKKYRRTCVALNAAITLTILIVLAGAATILVMSFDVISADLGGLRNLLLGFGIPALVVSVTSRAMYADGVQVSTSVNDVKIDMSPSELAAHARDKVKRALDELSDVIVEDDAIGRTS